MKRNTDIEITRKAIVRAMRLQRPVTITYVRSDGEETVRTIEPSSLTRNKDGQFYVKAMDRQSKETRSWRLDRIRFYTVGSGRSRFVLPAYVSVTQPPVAEPEVVTVLTDGPDGEDVVPGQEATVATFRFPGRTSYNLTVPATGDAVIVRQAVVTELYRRGITRASHVIVTATRTLPEATLWDGEGVLFDSWQGADDYRWWQVENRAENAWLVAAENTYFSAEEGGY